MKRGLFCVILSFHLMGCGSEQKAQIVPIDQVPKNLLDIAQEKLPDVTFEQALRKSNGILEVRGKDKTGKVRDIEFSPAGEVVEIE